MALTTAQRNDKYREMRLASDKIRANSPVSQELFRALQKRHGTSPGTPERAEADKWVAKAEATAGL